MSPQNDHGELLSAAVIDAVHAFEEWDVKQFRQPANQEWLEFVKKLQVLNNKVLDFCQRK